MSLVPYSTGRDTITEINDSSTTITNNPGGLVNEVQINLPLGTFGVGSEPVTIDVPSGSGNLTTSFGTNTGDVLGAGYVPSQPVAADTFDGLENPIAPGTLGHESKIYKLEISRGTQGQNSGVPFRQNNLVIAGGPSPYGFPGGLDDVMWANSSCAINTRNCIIGILDGADADIAQGAGVQIEFATTTLGQDGCYFDPLNMRAGTSVTSHSRFGFNPNSLGRGPGMLRVEYYINGGWTSPPAAGDSNKMLVTMANVTAGWTKILGLHHWTTSATGAQINGSVTIMTFNQALGESWSQSDVCEILFTNTSTTADFTGTRLHAVIDYWQTC